MQLHSVQKNISEDQWEELKSQDGSVGEDLCSNTVQVVRSEKESSGRTYALCTAVCTVHCTVVSSEEQAVGGPGVAAQSCAGSPPCHTSMASSCLILQVDCLMHQF